jgi:hypothetical protein
MPQNAPGYLRVDVECHAGYRAEETPRRFRLAEIQVEIDEVMKSWLEPDYRYFKVRDTQGELYMLRNDVVSDQWELTRLHRSALGLSEAWDARIPVGC